MLDGIGLKYNFDFYAGKDFEAWQQTTNIYFTCSVITATGEIKTKKRNEDIITTHRAKWETFDLIVKEVLNTTTGKTVFHIVIHGSLHKNEYAGKNYLPFTWIQVCKQVNHICKTLHLNPSQLQILHLEVGVNVLTPFVVTPFLRHNIINYKGEPFTWWPKDKTGFRLGIYCDTTQYRVKIYDKGKQNDLPQNLMRFEKRFLRMQPLNKVGIKYLADLLNRDKVSNLLPMLLSTWQNVLIYDIETGLIRTNSELKESEIELLTTGQFSDFWVKLKETGSEEFKYQRKKFKNLVAKNGNNWQLLVNRLIENEWQELFKNSPNLHSGKIYNELSTFPEFTIKIKGKNGEKRYCQTCGKDISHQRKGSKNCSEKYNGKAGKQCRNKISNPRNNRKNKIEKIQRRGVLFDITPFIIPLQVYNHYFLK